MNRILIWVVVLASAWSGGAVGAAATGDAEGTDHTLFTDLLREYVTDGSVNYRGLCEEGGVGRLETYISQLAATDPETIIDDDERLAFWINAYNAYTLKIICDNYPVKSINDLHFGGLYIGTVLNKTAWDKQFVILGGETYSLNDVEHKIIRPRFEDARAHFALVCAAVSCPPLRPEAYTGDRLDEQLDDQGRIFFAEPNKNHFDREKKIAYLSKILDWYEGDFGEDDEALLLAITPYLPDDLAGDIRANPGAWDIKHTDYDWSLNE
jgi:hypothetical protein